jgi:hypothetical protein
MKSFFEMQMAIDLEPHVPGHYWNLGLIKSWASDLNETRNAWEEAANLSQEYGKGFCLSLYRSAIYALYQEKGSLFEKQIEQVKEHHVEAKKGYLKMIIKDLKAVKLAVFGQILVDSFHKPTKLEKTDGLCVTYWKINLLEKVLKEILTQKMEVN